MICCICTSLQSENYITDSLWYYCLEIEHPKLYISKFLLYFENLWSGIVAFLHHAMLFFGLHFCTVFFCTKIWSSFCSIIPLHFPFFSIYFLSDLQPISYITVESYFKLFYNIFVPRNKSAIWVYIQFKLIALYLKFKTYNLQQLIMVK